MNHPKEKSGFNALIFFALLCFLFLPLIRAVVGESEMDHQSPRQCCCLRNKARINGVKRRRLTDLRRQMRKGAEIDGWMWIVRGMENSNYSVLVRVNGHLSKWSKKGIISIINMFIH